MKKKWMAFLAWLLLACGCLGCAPGFYGAEPLLDAETAGRILGIYEEEVRMVEETFGEDLSDYTAEDDEIRQRRRSRNTERSSLTAFPSW